MQNRFIPMSLWAAGIAAALILTPTASQAGNAAYNALVDSQAILHLGMDETSGTLALNSATVIANTNAQSTTLTNDYVYGSSVTLGVTSLAGLGAAVQNNAPGTSDGYLAYLNKDYELESHLAAYNATVGGTRDADFTIEFWFNANNASDRQDLFSTNGGGLFINTVGGGSIQYYDSNSIASSAGAFLADTWNLLDIVHTASTNTVTIYLNGVAVASGDSNGTTFRDPYWGNLIGANLSPSAALATNFEFTGAMDEFALYNRVLTTGDMQQRVNLAAVPEPATWAMLVGGLGVLTLGQRLRRRQA